MKKFTHKSLLLLTVPSQVLFALPVTARADGGSEGNVFAQTVDGYQPGGASLWKPANRVRT